MMRGKWLFPGIAVAGFLLGATGLIVTTVQKQTAETGQAVARSELQGLAEKNQAACKADRAQAEKILGAGVCQQTKEIVERPPAEKGDPGEPGARGAVGPQGPAGPQGPIGPEGIAGPRGPQGVTGPPPGCALLTSGCVGAQGTQGPAGEAGPAGARGEPGLQGEQGEAGPKGETGETGPQGPPGIPGPDSSAVKCAEAGGELQRLTVRTSDSLPTDTAEILVCVLQ